MLGFDILETSPGNILVYAINHRRNGSTIERFHHTIGSGKLVYERSFDCNNDIVFTPNDVAVVGKDEFYVTNVILSGRATNVRIMSPLKVFGDLRVTCFVFHCVLLHTTTEHRVSEPLQRAFEAQMESQPRSQEIVSSSQKLLEG